MAQKSVKITHDRDLIHLQGEVSGENTPMSAIFTGYQKFISSHFVITN